MSLHGTPPVACKVPGCTRLVTSYTRLRLCNVHYKRRAWAARRRPGLPEHAWFAAPLAVFPAYPRRVAAALAELAERAAAEGWTGERFETEQRRVLDGRVA